MYFNVLKLNIFVNHFSKWLHASMLKHESTEISCYFQVPESPPVWSSTPWSSFPWSTISTGWERSETRREWSGCSWDHGSQGQKTSWTSGIAFLPGDVHILRTCFLDLFWPTHPPCTPIVLHWKTHRIMYVLPRLTHPPQNVFKYAL